METSRARRAMEILSMAEAEGVVYARDRQRAVEAARGVLCDEFWDVRLEWETTGHYVGKTLGDLWQLVARGPDGDRCRWADVRPGEVPGQRR